jgi:hypothetical protein
MAAIVSGDGFEVGGIGGGGRGAGPGLQAGPPPAAVPSSRLEYSDYKWTESDGRLVVKAYRCKCRTCAHCAGQYGWRVRSGLLEKAEHFKKPGLLTLTPDRNRFESPEDVYIAVTNAGLIRRLMRLLGVSIWVWVLEFQQKTGTGWPHWHPLLDLSTLPSARLDLGRAWDLWRGKWAVGGVDLQVRNVFDDPIHAIFYVTKYLVKYPELGFPYWVRHFSRRIRFFQGCQALGPILGGIKPTTRCDNLPDEVAIEASGRARGRTLAEREAECGMRSIVLRERRDADGSASYGFVGTLPIRPGRLIMLSELGRLGAAVQIVKRCVERDSLESEWLEACLAENRRMTELDQLDALRRQLEVLGESARCISDIEERRRLLDDSSKWRGRTDDRPGDVVKPDDGTAF